MMLSKKEFLKRCGESDPIARLCVDSTIDRDRDRVIELSGLWGGGCFTSVTLYRPGREGEQGRDCYRSADAAVAKVLPKFKRWLAEFKAMRPASCPWCEDVHDSRPEACDGPRP